MLQAREKFVSAKKGTRTDAELEEVSILKVNGPNPGSFPAGTSPTIPDSFRAALRG